MINICPICIFSVICVHLGVVIREREDREEKMEQINRCLDIDFRLVYDSCITRTLTSSLVYTSWDFLGILVVNTQGDQQQEIIVSHNDKETETHRDRFAIGVTAKMYIRNDSTSVWFGVRKS